jgi:hypothetical protein
MTGGRTRARTWDPLIKSQLLSVTRRRVWRSCIVASAAIDGKTTARPRLIHLTKSEDWNFLPGISLAYSSRAQRPGACPWWGKGRPARSAYCMAHVWTDKYGALYDRTYRVLYDAGINERLADALATQRTLAAALTSCEQAFRRSENSDDFVGGEFSRTR